jgi:hypothetical protein
MQGAVIWRLPAGWGRAVVWRGVAGLAVVTAGCLAWLALWGAPGSSPSGGAARTTRIGARAKMGLTGLPIALQAAASSSLGADSRRFAVGRVKGRGLVATGGGLSTVFGRSGPVVRAGGSTLALSLVGVGRGSSVSSPSAASPVAAGNRVWYPRGLVSEWYVNGPIGLEQGFTVLHRLAAGAGPLRLSLAVGGLRPVASPNGVSLRSPGTGASVLRYGALVATDARGDRLPAWWSVGARGIDIRVRDRGARYPLRIDPFIQQGPKLVGSGAVGSVLREGWSVALSADGNTALIGGPYDGGPGAAWVFTRAGSTWSQQGSKLVGTGAAGGAKEGWSVALSADVALSDDGDTALIASSDDDNNAGAAWIFTRVGSTWTQQGPKLVGTGAVGAASQGQSVSLSGDGDTVLIGGANDNGGAGAAWIFTRVGSTWSQQGSKLIGTGAVGPTSEGVGVALSGDGNTALIGGPADNNSVGAAWVFTRSGSTWSQQGSKLVGTGYLISLPAFPLVEEGFSVALSGDGNTALIGGPDDNKNAGAAWVFTRSGSTWSQLGSKLVGTGAAGDGAYQGWSVALSGDGNTALIGGPLDNSNAGAAWVFAALRVDSVSPSSGITGSQVTITGTGLSGATSVKFGSLAASFAVVSDTEIDAVVPNGVVAGKVSVATPGGTTTSSQAFTPTLSITSFSPACGPFGTVVAVKLIGFTPSSTVKFNGTAATVPSTATTGPVTLTNTAAPVGTVQARTNYTVTPHIAPTITSFTPTSGISGSPVTITGANLCGASMIAFGGALASNFTIDSSTELKANVSRGAVPGPISVTTAAGTGASSTDFTPTLSITGFSPGSGPPGTVVDVTGIGFTPGSTVKFNGTTATTVSYLSSGEVKATVPAGATSGPITLTNTSSPTGTVRSAGTYTVT